MVRTCPEPVTNWWSNVYCPGGWGGHSGFPSDDDSSDDVLVVEAPEDPEGSKPHEPDSSGVLLQDRSAELDVLKAGPNFSTREHHHIKTFPLCAGAI